MAACCLSRMASTVLSLVICRRVACTSAHRGSVFILAKRLFAAQRNSLADSDIVSSLALVMMSVSDDSVSSTSFDMGQSVAADTCHRG